MNTETTTQPPSGKFEGYCVQCKVKKTVSLNEIVVTKRGTLVLKGQCVACDTTVARMMGRALLDQPDVDATVINEEEKELPRQVVEVCDVIQRQVASYLAEHSWKLYELPSDYFERLIAEILASFGFEVELNVRLLGSGVGDEADILAFRHVDGMGKSIGYVVECKRFAEHRKVDLQMASRLYGVKMRHAEKWGLDRALLVTTSAVTSDVQQEYGGRWDFEIKEHQQVVEWLQTYAKGTGGLYLPKQGLPVAGEELTLTNLQMLRDWR